MPWTWLAGVHLVARPAPVMAHTCRPLSQRAKLLVTRRGGDAYACHCVSHAMRGEPWRYSGLVWGHGVMGHLGLAWACVALRQLAWPCSGSLASRHEFVRVGGCVPLWDKTPPGGPTRLGGSAVAIRPSPQIFCHFAMLHITQRLHVSQIPAI